MRDGRAEPHEAETYLKRYVEVARGEPARQTALRATPHLKCVRGEVLCLRQPWPGLPACACAQPCRRAKQSAAGKS